MTGKRLDWVAYDETSTITPEQWAVIDRLTDEYRQNRNRFNERTDMRPRSSMLYDYVLFEPPTVPVQPEIKAWVKIPTLNPKDENALMLLGAADLDTLISRANRAKQKIEAETKAREANQFKPGQRVRTRFGDHGTIIQTAAAVAMFAAVTSSTPKTPEGHVWLLIDGHTAPYHTVPSSLTRL